MNESEKHMAPWDEVELKKVFWERDIKKLSISVSLLLALATPCRKLNVLKPGVVTDDEWCRSIAGNSAL